MPAPLTWDSPANLTWDSLGLTWDSPTNNTNTYKVMPNDNRISAILSDADKAAVDIYEAVAYTAPGIVAHQSALRNEKGVRTEWHEVKPQLVSYKDVYVAGIGEASSGGTAWDAACALWARGGWDGRGWRKKRGRKGVRNR